MIEHLFIATDRDGHVDYSPMGQRHLRLLDEYAALIPRVAKALNDDCGRFRPVDGRYSPYGVLYGFSSRLLEHMALKAAQPNTATRYSLEDVFVGGEADKLAWVSGWRRLPHVPREVAKLFEYPQRFAEEVFERVERELRRRVDGGNANDAVATGKLFISSKADLPPDPRTAALPYLPVGFVLSSDKQVVAANEAIECDEAALLHSRVEGEFLVSYRTSGGWVAISKDVLTEVLAQGGAAKIEGLPAEPAHRLRAACLGLAVLA
jgi:hypothetical protein